jgi:DNA (cytosine-5)-methyltransferase 1
MKYLSVCAGIEAATQGWHHLGWEPVAFSEIEPFPGAVLAHHYPNVPNWGDMTQFKTWPDATIDLLVGGTPCQSFSIAGLRKGLEDPRGNLMLTFLGIADRYRPKWIVWENVPGVLSSNGGKDFGTVLAALGELGYGWAYRVLDAQWFGVAQRRRRVFVVGCLGDQRSAAAVLFESEGVSRNPAPSREKGKGVAIDAQASLAPSCTDTVTAKWSKGAEALQQGAQDGGNCIPILMRQREGKDGGGKGPLISEEKSLTLATRNDQVLAFDTTQITSPLNYSNPQVGDPCHPLAAGAHIPAVAQPVAFTTEQTPKFNDECALTLTKQSPTGGGQPQCVSVAMQVRRLTPVECERLQGFPDNFTRIPWKKKPAEDCPDGPRYKALGNSMAVPCMRWIGEQIKRVMR